MKYLENLNPKLKEYFAILSCEFPTFLEAYIETKEMKKQNHISISCGSYYSNMSEAEFWYSSLDHSVAVALIIYHFTKDKKKTLAGLFHDIATPVFKHSIDFMNGDYETQESTEALTKKTIENSKEIMSLLKRDGIRVEEVCDYHIYPIADNDTPMLSADRLEYTLSNGLGATKKVWGMKQVKEMYDDLCVVKKENGEEELAFQTASIALQFVSGMKTLSLCYMGDRVRFSMQFLAEIMRQMESLNLLCMDDLYHNTEAEIIEKIKNCNEHGIADAFQLWRQGKDIHISKTPVSDCYCVNIKGKKRYIDPLVIDRKLIRMSHYDKRANDMIRACLDYDFDRYLYMNFDFKKEKVKRKC